jgi:hypothetical protein
LEAFFLGALFLEATAVLPWLVFLGEDFFAAKALLADAFAVALPEDFEAAALVAELFAEAPLLAELLVEVDFLLDPKTFDQPSAYLEFVPTRVIVTFQFS